MSTNREHTITSVTLWGAAANLVLAGAKMAAGVFGRSSAMVADAVHSLSDLVSDAVILVMVRISSKGRDKSHDWGHGKFETLATAFVSLLLLVVGAKLMVDAVGGIRTVISGGTLPAPGKIALWAALLSIAVKEALFQWTIRKGRKVNSPAMIANAWHHRSDALSSIGAAAGIGGAIAFGGKWTVLDPLVGALISVVIIIVAVKMAIPALAELSEASLPDDVENHILATIQAVQGVDNAHALKTRRHGPGIIIDVHIVVNPQMNVVQAHGITENVENALRREYGQDTQISVHVEPNVNSK